MMRDFESEIKFLLEIKRKENNRTIRLAGLFSAVLIVGMLIISNNF